MRGSGLVAWEADCVLPNSSDALGLAMGDLMARHRPRPSALQLMTSENPDYCEGSFAWDSEDGDNLWECTTNEDLVCEGGPPTWYCNDWCATVVYWHWDDPYYYAVDYNCPDGDGGGSCEPTEENSQQPGFQLASEDGCCFDGEYWEPCEDDGGGGGGGAYPISNPPTTVPASGEDMAPLNGDPSCASPRNIQETLWCNGYTPDATRRPRVDAAIARLKAKGGICATIGTMAEAIVARGSLRIYPDNLGITHGIGGTAPRGGGATGPNSWIALMAVWTDEHYDAAHKTTGESPSRTLQHSIAHEVDHLRGEGHVGEGTPNEDPRNTPNSQACSDVP
jgi:hypothetical protein